MDMHTANGASVMAGLGYLALSTSRPYNYMYEPPPGVMRDNCTFELHSVPIRDARGLASGLGLETSGFELLWQRSRMRDFYDDAEVRAVYCREIEALALALTGGLRAVVFDHQRRMREPDGAPLGFGRPGDGKKPAALGRVHNDYTEMSGPRRMRAVLPGAPDDRPYLILNFWRPIQVPAVDTPLAVCDARSFSPQDWVATEIIYPERTGEIYLAHHSDAHAWYYYPHMTPEEVLVFKSFDSRLDSPARMTPHCAFDDPGAPPDAPLRRSIEARCLVILE